MKKCFLLPTLFCIILLFCSGGTCNNAVNEIIINPSSTVKQGQTVFLEVKSQGKLKDPYFIYKDKKIKLYKKGDKIYSGILGIEAIENPGERTIILKDKKGLLDNKVDINIESSHFPVENIVITGEKSTLTLSENELSEMQKALLKISKTAYWSRFPFDSPVNGCISSIYGVNRYHNGQPTGDYHRGLDLAVSYGTPIKSIADGKVLLAKKFNYYGNTVLIDHGQGVASVYMHLSKFDVKPGMKVKQYQKIGEVGSTGFSTGPHLHFGIYINGININPLDLWLKPIFYCAEEQS